MNQTTIIASIPCVAIALSRVIDAIEVKRRVTAQIGAVAAATDQRVIDAEDRACDAQFRAIAFLGADGEQKFDEVLVERLNAYHAALAA